jgi:cytosine deaminase
MATKDMSEAEAAFHAHFLGLAIEEARAGLSEGGIPIGSVLIRRRAEKGGDEDQAWSIDGHEVVGRGHNRRVQRRSATLHAEMDCFEAAGRLTAADYARCILYSTLSPCEMCSGALLLYKIPTVVMGENATFQGPEAYVRSHGVRLLNLDSTECRRLMTDFIAAHPTLWNEDIGV